MKQRIEEFVLALNELVGGVVSFVGSTTTGIIQGLEKSGQAVIQVTRATVGDFRVCSRRLRGSYGINN